MERKDVLENYKWNTGDIFTDDGAWEQAFSDLERTLDFSCFQGTLNRAESVLAFFRAEEAFEKTALRLYLYAHLKHDEDVRVGKYNAYMAKISTLFTKLGAQTAFALPEITALPDKTLLAFAQDSRFFDYDYTLSRMIAEKKYILSDKEEKLLAMSGDMADVSSDVFEMLNDGELNLPEIEYHGKKITLSHGLYSVIMSEDDREKRAEAYGLYYSAFQKIINTLATAYYGNVKKDMFYQTARGYESCLAMALFHEDVSRTVYDNLVATVGEYTPLMHRYIAERKKVLKYDKLHFYDLAIPLVKDAELKLEYEDAFSLVLEGLAPLGEEYLSLLKKGKCEGWIDVCETEGKRSGAYSICTYGMHPYVLLNYQKTTHDVFTIAHEMGHALHSYFSNGSQPMAKADYKIFVAEVASTVNEVLLLKHLLKTATDARFKKYLLNYYLDMIRTTLFRQTQFAEFEQRAHERAEQGEPLNCENLSDLYLSLTKKYYGEDIEYDENIQIEWARIPHFYRSFYVYKYATGITAAIAIANAILCEGELAVTRYFEFLSSGSKTDPVSLLKIAGVDLTEKQPFLTAMEEFKNTIEEFETLA